MNEISFWMPWIVVAAIPGITNTLVAFRELDRKCQLLPFFEPYKIPGVWLWAIVELVIPGVSFWWISSLSLKPPIDFNLILKAATFGIGFAALLNSSTERGDQLYRIKSIYTLLIRYAYDAIRSNQVQRAAQFWADVEGELHQNVDLVKGLRFLESYFEIEASIALEPGDDYAREIELIEAISDRHEQAKQIKSLLQKVRRRDLPYTLMQFQFSKEWIRKYFSSRSMRTSYRHLRTLAIR